MGETSPLTVSFVSKKTPLVGEYVYLEYDNKIVLGMIESLLRGSTTLGDDILNPETIEKILNIEGNLDHYIRGKITILGDKDNLQIPRTPAPPGTEVKKADAELLREVFEQENGIKIGSILTEPSVPVKLDVNKMVSRHLAILAMTGAGKSNATSVIIDQLLAIGGTIMIFDMHSEYGRTDFPNGQKKTILPKINPRDLSLNEYKQLASIGENATNQIKYLRDAHEYANDLVKDGEVTDFIDTMLEQLETTLTKLENEENKRTSHIDAVRQVTFKMEDLKSKYVKILDSVDVDDIIDTIESGKVNIMGLGSIDERMTDILVDHTLNNILNRRRNAITNSKGKTLDYPIFCIIEEAHMLASEKRNTRSKYTIGKIAREGRKFGVGLCLISQSPKSLDSEALSQVNNMIILRLVEPGDQTHVQRSSESLSEDLLKQLPSLNIGEAIIVGQMTKIPTMVKIDEFKGKTIGNDLDIVGLWQKAKREKEERIQNGFDDLKDLGY